MDGDERSKSESLICFLKMKEKPKIIYKHWCQPKKIQLPSYIDLIVSFRKDPPCPGCGITGAASVFLSWLLIAFYGPQKI